MTDAVRVKLAADDILDMTLVAPEHGNALDAAMAEVMLKALRDLPDTAKAIVLTAEGASFYSGSEAACRRALASSPRSIFARR